MVNLFTIILSLFKIKQLTNIGCKDTYFLLIKQIFSKQIDAKYQHYGTLCIFSVYFITFRKYFRHLLSQNVKYRKKLDTKGKF